MLALAFAVAAAAVAPAAAQPAPKLGIDATPITEENEHLRLNATPDYWAFAPFVRPQRGEMAAPVAAVAVAVNGLKGLPESADEPILSQEALLERAGGDWGALTAEGGAGLTFAQLEAFTAAAVDAAGLEAREVRAWKPGSDDLNSISILREWLLANEATADDALIAYFDQGVLTGVGDGPHAALIGAYDPAAGRVLILEGDGDWHIPYWVSDVKLLEAMLQPASEAHGALEGETGGLVLVAAPPAPEG